MGLLFLLSVSSSLPHSSQAFYFSCFVLFIFPISLFLRLPSFPWSCSSFIWVLLWFYSLIFGCSLPHLLSLLFLSSFNTGFFPYYSFSTGAFVCFIFSSWLFLA